MNRFRQTITIPVVCALLAAAMPHSLRGQARPIEVPELNSQLTSSGVANLRVGSVSDDGTEAVLIMEYTYNGNAGPTALIVPVIENRKQRGVSGWFGSDRVSVPRGKGLISIKVKFFNDEPGAPATITTDSIRMLILNSTGTAIVGGSTELKTINWGKAGVQPAKSAEDRKLAQLAGEAETRAREKARRAAEAEERARREAAERETARARAEAEARAATEAKAKAEAEARARAEEKRLAEEKAAAEARAREEAGRKAAAEARRLAEERQAAEARARAQTEANEKARLEAEARKREQEQKQAEAEAARLLEERKKAEAKAAAEAKAREEADAKAQLEARRLEAERKAAEERVRAEEENRRLAAERAVAEAKAREQAEAQAAEAARIKTEQEAAEAARLKAAQPTQAPEQAAATNGRSRTKITNVDVVNRSLDRSQMTIGIEFDRKDKFNFLGVSVEHSANPAVKNYFACEPKEVGRQKYALVQVAYAKPAATATTVVTDRLLVYGSEAATAVDPIPLHAATMLLVWRAPGSSSAPAANPPTTTPASAVEITDFRQRTPTSGYASVTYQLPEGTGQLRVRLKNSTQAGSNNWFLTEPVSVKAGQGLELIPVTVSADSAPTGALTVDTIEVELLDAGGKLVSQTTKATSIIWSREP